MSFLGLYRDPTVAEVTSRCDWRIADLIDGERPVSLYLVIPPSDISRTKPLVRLVLNQIGRRLTERLDQAADAPRRHQLLMMLDEFPALGRLDFFETSLAFMAGYGIRAFLIAQSLNQIEKAYGEYNSILDNCHVRVAFATNDERTAKRISDALGTATEQRAMRNYAGHRLAPWLAHVMVSRQETAAQLLTPGEVMQLPRDRRARADLGPCTDPREQAALFRRRELRRAGRAGACSRRRRLCRSAQAALERLGSPRAHPRCPSRTRRRARHRRRAMAACSSSVIRASPRKATRSQPRRTKRSRSWPTTTATALPTSA